MLSFVRFVLYSTAKMRFELSLLFSSPPSCRKSLLRSCLEYTSPDAVGDPMPLMAGSDTETRFSLLPMTKEPATCVKLVSWSTLVMPRLLKSAKEPLMVARFSRPLKFRSFWFSWTSREPPISIRNSSPERLLSHGLYFTDKVAPMRFRDSMPFMLKRYELLTKDIAPPMDRRPPKPRKLLKPVLESTRDSPIRCKLARPAKLRSFLFPSKTKDPPKCFRAAKLLMLLRPLLVWSMIESVTLRSFSVPFKLLRVGQSTMIKLPLIFVTFSRAERSSIADPFMVRQAPMIMLLPNSPVTVLPCFAMKLVRLATVDMGSTNS
mmetsp:Transcript_12507/g.34859  ORF Transcript_12507/g.34859 Transcript_12507/m.34859 type:complete len:320 (+) Transcript_12507:1840-2799(+)